MATTELLIDTSIFIDHLRKTNKATSLLYHTARKNTLYTSTVVEFELFAGAKDMQKQNDIHVVLQRCAVLPMTSEIAQQAASIYRTLRQTNQMIEMRDIFIGATAIVTNLPLLTLNTKHFARLPQLQLASLPTDG